VEVLGIALGAAGVALSTLAIALVFMVDRARRPVLTIEPGHWSQPLFSHVAITNHPPRGVLGRRFRGTTAAGCRASLEFRRDGVTVLGPIDARWSGAPEPTEARHLPESYRWDLAATGTPEQIAITRTSGAEVYAFSAESYLFPDWRRPEWKLDPGTYDVVVRLASTEAEAERMLGLVIASDGRATVGLRYRQPHGAELRETRTYVRVDLGG